MGHFQKVKPLLHPKTITKEYSECLCYLKTHTFVSLLDVVHPICKILSTFYEIFYFLRVFFYFSQYIALECIKFLQGIPFPVLTVNDSFVCFTPSI